MRKAIATTGIALVVCSVQLVFAQRRPVSEADALAYIQSAFITQADPGVMASSVVIGPELQRLLSLPPDAEGAKVYTVLVSLSGQKEVEVRRATTEELAQYGARRGFERTKGPLYTVQTDDHSWLVQYDLQRVRISFVGQLGVPDPDPRPVVVAVDAPPTIKTFTPKTLQWTAQFKFNSAELTEETRATLDSEIVPQLLRAGELRAVHVSGHADHLGNAEYNHQLSEKRAEALRAYLVARGVDESKIEIFSYGQTLPAKSCPVEKGRALIECLAPNRRVELQISAQ